MKRTQIALAAMALPALIACADTTAETSTLKASDDAPVFYQLRPEVEQMFGYSHAVRIGSTLKISGAVSMDDTATPLGVGDMEAQMRNVYADLEKILTHHGYSFDDVVVEDVFTTDMAAFLEVAGYRNELYTNHFPTGTWLEVQGLALPEFMIEIEIEAYKAN